MEWRPASRPAALATFQGLVLATDGRYLWASVFALRDAGRHSFGPGLLTFARAATKGTLRQLAGKRGCTRTRRVPRKLAEGCERVPAGMLLGLPTPAYARDAASGALASPAGASGCVAEAIGDNSTGRVRVRAEEPALCAGPRARRVV